MAFTAESRDVETDKDAVNKVDLAVRCGAVGTPQPLIVRLGGPGAASQFTSLAVAAVPFHES